MAISMPNGTMVWTTAGRTTFLKGQNPSEVEHLLRKAIKQEEPFVYLDSDGERQAILAPRHVTALFAVERTP